jgi:hypothetical protein
MAAVGLVASGCVHVQVALAVSGTDLVSGEVIAAALPNPATPRGPVLTVPQAMADQATARSYNAGGYIGSELTFNNLSFAQLAALISAGTDQNSHFQLTFQRNGDLVNFAGSADLTQVSTQGAQVRLKVSFPGKVLQTDGANSSGTVTWNLLAGQVNTFSATAEYTNGGFDRPWSFWALALGGTGGVIALLITLLSLWARRRNIRKEALQDA